MRRIALQLSVYFFSFLFLAVIVCLLLVAVLPRADWDVVAVTDQINSQILVADVTRSLFYEVTPRDMTASEPVWSPDGRYIAFTRSVYDNDSPYSLRVYTMSRFGREMRRVSLDGGQGWNPVWSPDGTYIAYSGYRERTVGRATVFISTFEGTLVSDFSSSLSTLNTFLQAWSRDGQTMLVLAYNYVGDAGWGLYRLDPFSGASELIHDGYYHAVLSPDGRYMALTDNSTQQGIQVIELQNGEADHSDGIILTTSKGGFPSWSMDSQRLMFFDLEDGELYTVDVQSGLTERYAFTLPIDDEAHSVFHLAWRP